MNYLKQINEFNEQQIRNPLPHGQFRLWIVLMSINNKAHWMEWFQVASSTLESQTTLSRQGMLEARKQLKELGYIDFRPNGNQAPYYKMIKLYTQEETQETVQQTVQQTVPLYKQNKTRQNETEKEKVKKEKAPQSAEPTVSKFQSDFNALWVKYPRKEGKAKAFKSYERAIKKGVTNETISQGIDRYNAHIARNNTTMQYVKQGSTWFNNQSWDDEYVDSNQRKEVDREHFFDY